MPTAEIESIESEERRIEESMLEEGLLNANILMVDDDPVLVKIIGAQLRAIGHRNFNSVSDPYVAYEYIVRNPPDLILLDLVMPGLNGFDILKLIRENSAIQHLPVVMLTSSTDAETKLEALGKGVTDFLPKPIDSSELILRIRNLLTVKAYQDRLAYYDPLTGLPNRLLYMDRLDWAMKNAKRNRTQIAVLDIGVDHFRKINESLGPGAGDKLLKALAQRLLDCVRQTDVVSHVGGEELWRSISRLGGDEFSILLTSLATADNAGYVALRILQAMEQPFWVNDQELFISVSIGIAIYPIDGESPDVILQHASSATDQVKKLGRANYQFFSESLHKDSRRQLSLEMDLHKALERNELVLHFQPQIDQTRNRVVGAEALIRWQHPVLGTLAPDKFIPLAEKMGLILPIGDWVLKEVCRVAALCQSLALTEIEFSINISAHQFLLDSLAENIHQYLEEHALPSALLTVELTESVLVKDVETTAAILTQLRDVGVKVSIDDFGTGYSSLSYLQQFPVDELKVDRSFLTGLSQYKNAEAIVSSIIRLAKDLGLKIVAEGVETEQQLSFLRAKECSIIQGYYYAKPLEAEALIAFIKTFNRVL